MRFFLLLVLLFTSTISNHSVLAKDIIDFDNSGIKEPAVIENPFSIESGAGILFNGSYSTAPLFNVTVLFSNDFNDRFNYFFDYSLSPSESNPIAEGAEPSPQLVHILLWGGRYYFNLPHDFITPYASLGIGAIAMHNTENLRAFLALPMVSVGLGADYMFTENFGLNMEISLLLIILRGKIGLKYVF